jgi:hypothetical protein
VPSNAQDKDVNTPEASEVPLVTDDADAARAKAIKWHQVEAARESTQAGKAAEAAILADTLKLATNQWHAARAEKLRLEAVAGTATATEEDIAALEASQIKADKSFRVEAIAMMGVVKRMLTRHLSMAFEKWEHMTAQMMYQEAVMRGSQQRMLQRHLSMAFEKWQDVVAAMQAPTVIIIIQGRG